MKTEYKTDSWHYKLLKAVHGEYFIPNNTCDYWGMFIKSSILVMLLVFLTVFFSYFGGKVFIYEPLKFAYYYFLDHDYYIHHLDDFAVVFFLVRALIAILTICSFFAILGGIFHLTYMYKTYLRNQRKSSAYEDFKAAIRNKYCKEIIFIEKEKKNE